MAQPQETIEAFGVVSYISASSEGWVLLAKPQNAPASRWYNSKLLLDGQIHLTQVDGRAWKATAIFTPGDYQVINVNNIPSPTRRRPGINLLVIDDVEITSEGLKKKEDFEQDPESVEIILNIHNKPSLVTTGNHTMAAESLIALMSHSVTKLKITIPDPTKISNWSVNRALSLLSGSQIYTRKNDMTTWMTTELAAIDAEATHTLQRISAVNGVVCSVTTEQYRGREILLLIYPPEDLLISLDFDNILYAGQKLYLSGDRYFTLEEAERHPSAYCDDSHWCARVLHGLDRGAITAVLAHTIESDNYYNELLNLENEPVYVFPETFDPTSDRAVKSLHGVSNAFEEQEDIQLRLLVTAWKQDISSIARNQTEIPISSLLLATEPAVQDVQHMFGFKTYPPLTDASRQYSMEQKHAIQNIYDHTISCIQGPPGCAKTQTIVFAVESLLSDLMFKGQILICAPTNNACREVSRKIIERQAELGAILDFQAVHVIPRAASEAQIFEDGHDELEDMYLHSQAIRLAASPPLMDMDSRRFPDFNCGIRHIQERGFIQHEQNRKRYVEARDILEKRILSERRVVVSTCASASLPWLGALLSQRCEVLFIDEAAAAKHFEVLMPIIACHRSLRRVVLVGDHQQFSPVSMTDQARDAWQITIFEKLITCGWPSTMLTTNYRTHSDSCSATSLIFYDGKVVAPRSTQQPGWYLEHYLTYGPLVLENADNRNVSLPGWAHFIDVANSQHTTQSDGSTSNELEANAIVALIAALIQHGTYQISQIMVVVGYRAQKYLLKRIARQQGWSSLDISLTASINTVHGSQGASRHVVIFGITKTGADLGTSFMTTRQLVNVATSRHQDVMFVVGHWDSIVHLRRLNSTRTVWLRELLMAYRTICPGFVVRGGRAPFKIEHQDAIAPTAEQANSLVADSTRIFRDKQATDALETINPQIAVVETHLAALRSDTRFTAWYAWYKMLGHTDLTPARWEPFISKHTRMRQEMEDLERRLRELNAEKEEHEKALI